jgi:hypothetical protein
MSHDSGGHVPPSNRDPVNVRILRIDKGRSFVVRFLAYNPYGLYVHWRGSEKSGRSVYCCGVDLGCPCHKQERFWRGYAPVEVQSPSGTLWYPTVLEISEAMELDFRGTAERGTVWQVERLSRRAGRRSGLKATLLGRRDPSKLRSPFDVLPILRTCYHAEEISLVHLNPAPPRVLLEPTYDCDLVDECPESEDGDEPPPPPPPPTPPPKSGPGPMVGHPNGLSGKKPK